MYIIIEGKKALIIDPHEDSAVLDLLKNVEDITILLTHEHPDHISGVYWLKQRFKTTLICSKYCANYISEEKNVRPLLMTFVLEERDRLNGTNVLEEFKKEFIPRTYIADITFEKDFRYKWLNHNLYFQNILGHSKGSCVIILDEEVVFTGDSLLKDFPIITRFPGGSTKEFKNNTIPFLEKFLNPEMSILPGHGNPFKLNEIMKDGKIYVELK